MTPAAQISPGASGASSGSGASVAGILGHVLGDGLAGAAREAAAERGQRVALAQLAHDGRRGRVDCPEARLGLAAQPHEPPAAWRERAHQYVSLPPE